jgi:NAD(P)H-nitrite reductase large subunit
MADDTTNRGQQDRIRVNIHEEHELRYWTQRFGCTREALEAAVKKVGVMAADVEQALKQ